MCDQFGYRASGRGTLLRTMPGKATGEVEVGEIGVRADYGVLVERVVVVETGPSVHNLDTLEHWHPRCQPGPHVAIEETIVDLIEVDCERLFFFFRGLAAKEDPPLGPEPHARRVDGQRAVAQRFGGFAAIDDVDKAFAWLDRQGETGQGRKLSGPRPCCVDERLTRQPGTARELHCLDAGARVDARYLIVQQQDAPCSCRVAQERSQAWGIEPAFPGSAEGAGADVFRGEPRESAG